MLFRSLGFWVNVSSFIGSACSGIASNFAYTIFGTTSNYQGYTNTFCTSIQSTNVSNAVGTANQSNFSTNTWYYYFTVYDGSLTGNSNRLKLWINNTQYTLTYDATVPSTPYNANSTLGIGYGPAANFPYFNGKISVLTYYNRALTAAEILQNYNATKSRFGL